SFMPRSTMKTMERYNDRKKNNIKFLSLNRYIIQSLFLANEQAGLARGVMQYTPLNLLIS
ncbi:MAG TPA: hypothetical protein VLF94_05800, partial [Chlamydiales bacterium]|nr:hypothetical protein [Chlamydiales bacterium]